MALRLASSTLPSDRITWVTVGSASGIAAIASDDRARRTARPRPRPRLRPRTNITTIVSPAAAAIHRVSVFELPGQRRLLRGGRRQHPGDLAELGVGARCRSRSSTPLPCVTGVFMNAMFVWSPGPSSPSGSVAASLAAGMLSPVSADSSICSALAATMRPSAGTWSPAASSTTSPTTTCSAGISRLDAVAADPGGRLHHRLERVHRALGLALLAQADHRVDHGQQRAAGRRCSTPGSASDTTAAATRMICM